MNRIHWNNILSDVLNCEFSGKKIQFVKNSIGCSIIFFIGDVKHSVSSKPIYEWQINIHSNYWKILNKKTGNCELDSNELNIKEKIEKFSNLFSDRVDIKSNGEFTFEFGSEYQLIVDSTLDDIDTSSWMISHFRKWILAFSRETGAVVESN